MSARDAALRVHRDRRRRRRRRVMAVQKKGAASRKKKGTCMERKTSQDMRETRGTGMAHRQRIARALSIARKHCGVRRRRGT